MNTGIHAREHSIFKTILVALWLVSAVSASVPVHTAAQAPAFTDVLLDKVRAAARVVPGDLPHSLRVLTFQSSRLL